MSLSYMLYWPKASLMAKPDFKEGKFDIGKTERNLLVIYKGPLISSSLFLKCIEGFPGGAVVENLPANAGDTGSSPGPGRSHMSRSN